MINKFLPEHRSSVKVNFDSNLVDYGRNTILTKENTYWLKQYKFSHGILLDYILATGLEGKAYNDLIVKTQHHDISVVFKFLFGHQLFRTDGVDVLRKKGNITGSPIIGVFKQGECICSERSMVIAENGLKIKIARPSNSTSRGDTNYTYDHTNGVRTVKYEKNKKTQHYNKSGYITYQTDHKGKNIVIEYDENDNVSYIEAENDSIVFFDDNTCAYNGVLLVEEYDENGYLVKLNGTKNMVNISTEKKPCFGYPNKTEYHVTIKRGETVLFVYNFIHGENND